MPFPWGFCAAGSRGEEAPEHRALIPWVSLTRHREAGGFAAVANVVIDASSTCSATTSPSPGVWGPNFGRKPTTPIKSMSEDVCDWSQSKWLCFCRFLLFFLAGVGSTTLWKNICQEKQAAVDWNASGREGRESLVFFILQRSPCIWW